MFDHRVGSWTVEQSNYIVSVAIAGFPVLDLAIANRFFNASVGFSQMIHTSDAANIYANICMPKQQ